MKRRRLLLVFAVVWTLVGQPGALFASTSYTERWTPLEWRDVDIEINDTTGAWGNAWNDYNYYLRYGYTVTLTPNMAIKSISPSFCLGPSKWQVTTRAGSQETTEYWTAGSWKDTLSSSFGVFDTSYIVRYSNKGQCDNPSGIRFGGLNYGGFFHYVLTIDCWRRYWDSEADIASCGTRDVDMGRTTNYKRVVRYDTSIEEMSIAPAGEYGALMHRDRSEITSSTKSAAELYMGSLRSFPATWHISGSATP